MTPPDAFAHFELAVIAQGMPAQIGDQAVQTAERKTILSS